MLRIIWELEVFRHVCREIFRGQVNPSRRKAAGRVLQADGRAQAVINEVPRDLGEVFRAFNALNIRKQWPALAMRVSRVGVSPSDGSEESKQTCTRARLTSRSLELAARCVHRQGPFLSSRRTPGRQELVSMSLGADVLWHRCDELARAIGRSALDSTSGALSTL